MRTTLGRVSVVLGASFILAGAPVWGFFESQAMVRFLVDSSQVGEGETENQDCIQIIGSITEVTVAEVLKANGISASLQDRVTAFPDPALGIGSTVTYCKAPQISIVDAGVALAAESWAPTVGAALEEWRVDIGEKDIIEPALDMPIRSGSQIIIKRVAETELTKTVRLDFSTKYIDDPTIDKGVERVEVQGAAGERVDTYIVRRENGVEVSRTLSASVITSDPVSRVVRRGTKVMVLGVGRATFCDNYNNASGTYIFGGGCLGRLSAASNVLPRGAKVRVTNTANGKSVVVTINDSGIRHSDPLVIIDLSQDAFDQIGEAWQGKISVKIEKE